MRWPIRNQILVPFVIIQLIMIVSIAAVASFTAVRQAEARIVSRLAGIFVTLEASPFPLTANVLQQLQQLSGAQFVVLSAHGDVVRSTLDHIGQHIDFLDKLPLRRSSDEMTAGTRVTLSGESYLITRVAQARGQEQTHVLVLYRQADWNTARWQAVWPPFAVGGVWLIVTVTTSILVARRVGRRISSVQQQVDRITDGDLSPRSLPTIDDELRDLTATVNRVAAMLEETWRRRREHDRSALLTQMVGGLAHQLRNAVTGARISIQFHQKQCSSAEKESMNVALQQLQLTEEQLKSLLRVTRGETRSKVSGTIPVIVAETTALISPICKHQRIGLQVTSTGGDASVDDADALRAALLNLLMNAIEAAGPEGRIEVDSLVEANSSTIEVRDSGPGLVNPDEIFQPFFSTKREGIGLGLSLARQAAEDCQGTLSVERRNDLTCFRLVLRVGDAVPPSRTTEVNGRESTEPDCTRSGLS